MFFDLNGQCRTTGEGQFDKVLVKINHRFNVSFFFVCHRKIIVGASMSRVDCESLV